MRDPFDLYGLLADSGKGIRAGTPDRQAKAYAVIGARPDALVLGGSRAHMGYWTSDIGWEARRSYNLGLNGASVYEMRRMLQHAAAIGNLKQILVTLDLESFRTDTKGRDLRESYLVVTSGGWRSPGWLLNLVAATFSIDAIIRAVYIQSAGERLYDESGNGLHAQLRIPKTAEAFRSVANRQLGDSAYWLHPDRYLGYAKADSWPIDEFRRLLETACGEGAAVYVAVNPVHVSLLQLMEELGSLDVRDHWRAAVFNVFDAHTRRGCNAEGFWDFTSFAPYTEEPLPFLGETNNLPRYWVEPSHFTPALGQLVLDQAMRTDARATVGRKVSNDRELRALIAADRGRFRRWQASHPSVARHVAERGSELAGR